MWRHTSLAFRRRRCVSCVALTRWENVSNKVTTVYILFRCWCISSLPSLTLYSIHRNRLFIKKLASVINPAHHPANQPSIQQVSCKLNAYQFELLGCFVFVSFRFDAFLSLHPFIHSRVYCERTFRFVVSLVIFFRKWSMINDEPRHPSKHNQEERHRTGSNVTAIETRLQRNKWDLLFRFVIGILII